MGWGWAGRSLAGIVVHRWRICPKSGGLAVTMELAGQCGCLSILQGRSKTLCQDNPPPPPAKKIKAFHSKQEEGRKFQESGEQRRRLAGSLVSEKELPLFSSKTDPGKPRPDRITRDFRKYMKMISSPLKKTLSG